MRLSNVVRSSSWVVKGIGVDHASGCIHVDVRDSAEPVYWVYRNDRAVVTKDPFLEVVNG